MNLSIDAKEAEIKQLLKMLRMAKNVLVMLREGDHEVWELSQNKVIIHLPRLAMDLSIYERRGKLCALLETSEDPDERDVLFFREYAHLQTLYRSAGKVIRETVREYRGS